MARVPFIYFAFSFFYLAFSYQWLIYVLVQLNWLFIDSALYTVNARLKASHCATYPISKQDCNACLFSAFTA